MGVCPLGAVLRMTLPDVKCADKTIVRINSIIIFARHFKKFVIKTLGENIICVCVYICVSIYTCVYSCMHTAMFLWRSEFQVPVLIFYLV